jgi:predicted ATPase
LSRERSRTGECDAKEEGEGAALERDTGILIEEPEVRSATMLTRLRLDNYRCFDAFDQTLGGYLVLVGPNGSGKSTLLDSLVLLGDLAGPQTCSEVFLGATRGEGAPRAQALLELLHRGQGTQFTLEVEALAPSKLDLPPAAADEVVDRNAQPGRELLYQLTFELQPPDRLIIANELLIVLPVEGYDQGGGPTEQQLLTRGRDGAAVFRSEPYGAGGDAPDQEFRFELPPDRTALSNLPADHRLFATALWFRDHLTRGVLLYQPDWRRMRRPSPPGQPASPSRDGSNLPWLAKRLWEEDRESFLRWEAHVQTALPDVEAVRAVVREEDHHAYLRLRYRAGYEVTSSGLSHGTLRLLALTLLPYLPALPGLIAVEEPEEGLHPRAIETVMQSLGSAYGSQVLVTTQSPLVVAQTVLRDILSLHVTPKGGVVATPGEQHPVLQHWKGESSLGTLFAAGVFD